MVTMVTVYSCDRAEVVDTHTVCKLSPPPSQVLGKSAKPIPVLILGVLLSHKSYHISKYLIVLLIVAGVALFLYHGDGKGNDNDDQWRLFNVLGIGELLVVRLCACMMYMYVCNVCMCVHVCMSACPWPG